MGGGNLSELSCQQFSRLEQLISLKQAIHQPEISLTKTSDLYLAAQDLFHTLPSVKTEHLVIFLDIFVKLMKKSFIWYSKHFP